MLRKYILKIIREKAELFKWVKKNDLVSCEKCKCLILKENAIKGKSAIRKELIIPYMIWEKEYIYMTYYCLTHASKKKKADDK